MRIFFNPEIESGKLPPEEAQHAARVLRLKSGDKIQLINGHGTLATAIVTEIDKRKCSYSLENQEVFENPVQQLNLAVSPTKSTDRLEWMLEKMVEIGIGTIYLIITDRTERVKLNMDRLQKKIISAAKQSHKYHLPEIVVYQKYQEFLDKETFDIKLIAHLIETERTYIGSALEKNKTTCVLIGPEGDFTEAELKQASLKGYKSVTLGDFRLRTETAAVFATTIMNHTRY